MCWYLRSCLSVHSFGMTHTPCRCSARDCLPEAPGGETATAERQSVGWLVNDMRMTDRRRVQAVRAGETGESRQHSRNPAGKVVGAAIDLDIPDLMAAPGASPPRAVNDAPHRTGIVPMMAALSALPADEDSYAFEVKWDGMRAIAHCEPGGLWLQTRTLRDITGGFPELAGLQNQLGARNAVIDGEIVAFDADGRPSFQRLQS